MPHRDFSIDGERYPSVTEILGAQPKPWLQAWKDKWGYLAERKVEQANNIGTAFHTAIETGVIHPQSARLIGMLNSFGSWMINATLKIQTHELHVVSDIYHYHGTFDAIGALGKSKELVLFDWKTSSGIYPDMALQLSAYGQAYFEQTGKRIKRGMIVHVSKDKPHHKLTVKEYTLGKLLFNKFLKRLNEYREMKEEV